MGSGPAQHYLSTGSTQDTSRRNWTIIDWEVKNQINKQTNIFSGKVTEYANASG